MSKIIKRNTMLELKDSIYKENGWIRKQGESMSTKILKHYTLEIDHQNNKIIATPKGTKE